MGVTEYDRQMADLVARRDAEHELWGWKDPRTCLTLEKWAPLLSDPYYLECYRSVGSVCKSLLRRNGIPMLEGARLLEEYESRIESLVSLECWYERALADPPWFVKGIADYIVVEPTCEAVEFIDPSLDHAMAWPTCA